MKIGIYDPYLRDGGGGEKYMMTIAACLSGNNDITVFWDDNKDLNTIIDRFSLDLSKVKVCENIFSRSYPLLKRLRESRKYDAIFILSDGSIPFLLTRRVYVHIQQPLKQFENGSIKNDLKLARITKIFCNSEYTKSYIHKKFGLKTYVIYPPVDVDAKTKDTSKENIILHVGRFRPHDCATGITDYKKQQVMIDAFKSMVDKGIKNWQFVIVVGVQEEDRKELERMKKSAENYPIVFYINKNNAELIDAYSKAKIYWHASGFGEDLTLHPERAEHFGISTVEAMGSGVVPVVFNAGGQKEIVTHKKDGLLWNSIEELTEETRLLIANPKFLKTLSEEAKKIVQKYDKDIFCQQIHALLQ